MIQKFFVFQFCLLCTVTVAADNNSVNGVFTVDDQSVTLQYAYLHKETDPFDSSQLGNVLTVTDVTVGAEQLQKKYKLVKMADEGKLRYIQLRFGSDRIIYNVEIHHPALLLGYFSGGGTPHVIKLSKLTKNTAEGHAFFEKQRCGYANECAYDFTFKASITPDAK